MSNKIVFGISNLHFGRFTVNADKSVTMGEPYHLPGAVRLALDAQTDESKTHADNIVYWSCYSDSGYDGEIESALITDYFKLTFLGYKQLNDGGIGNVGAPVPQVYMMFESDGDENKRRGIIYGIDLGGISNELATEEGTKDPATSTMPFTAYGDPGTKILRANYSPGDGRYDTLFTDPPAPEELTYFTLQDEDGLDLLTNDGEPILGSIPLGDVLDYQRDQL